MIAKSKEPLFCRSCGGSIPKWTKTVYVKDSPGPHDAANAGWWSRYVYVGARSMNSIDDCRPLTNGIVTSVSYNRKKGKGDQADRRITAFKEWDGESYASRHFCKNACALTFAEAVAATSPTIGSQKWRDAVARAKPKPAPSAPKPGAEEEPFGAKWGGTR